jgi:hypothetical protein
MKVKDMPIFRADLYLRIKTNKFDLKDSSENLFKILETISFLRNVQITKVRKDEELHGRMVIKEWYEITGSIDVVEGSKSFWVLSKEFTQDEPYNFFMRLDRNIEAENYEIAQNKAQDWVSKNIIDLIKTQMSIENIELDSPIKFSKTANSMRVLH